MTKERFIEERNRIVSSFEPSAGHDLDGMEMDLYLHLTASNIVDDSSLEFSRSDDANALLRARCVLKSGVALEEAVKELTHIWNERLRYKYFEAHDVRLENQSVLLDFVTQIGVDEFFVTGTIEMRMQPS